MSEELVRWSNKVEACIQARLQDLIAGDFSGVEPDPVTCTSFETRAIEKVNECYRIIPEGKDNDNQPELCRLLDNGISEQMHQDLTNLVRAFNVGGEYHESTVDAGIPELVRDCGHAEVANSLYIGEPRLRLIFCVWALDRGGGSSNNELVRMISQYFDDSESNFQYGSLNFSRLCAEKGPDSGPDVDTDHDIHVVTWFALANNTVAQEWNRTAVQRQQERFLVVSFFEFTYDRSNYLVNRIRDYSKCGNGRRDPGEMCDYAMLNSSACSLKCQIEQPSEESGGIYECSTERLDQSYCWLQQCGDGKKTSAEECDDGNTNDGDGCSSQCRKEPQFTCRNRYNQTSECKSQPPVIATQRQITRSNVVQAKHTDSDSESTPLRTTVDVPLDSRGLSSAGRLISRTGLVLLTVLLTTLWTMPAALA